MMGKVALPIGPYTPAIELPHFPTRAHAFVWRNWTLVEPDRLAVVLGTSSANIVQMARSMGLPEVWPVCSRMLNQGQMTLLRRNWHLLPYDQLLLLMDMSEEELNFYLREDDVAFVKLGNVKPQCETLRYCEPDDVVNDRTAEIREIVRKHFGDLAKHVGEPRFAFVDEWRRDDTLSMKSYDPDRMHRGLNCLYSYFGVFGDPLIDLSTDPYPDRMLAALADKGVNGVWMHVVLRQLAPGGECFPEFGEDHECRLDNLRRMVERARRFGIGIYLYLNEPRAMHVSFFDCHPESKGVVEGEFAAMCSSSPMVRQWMSDATAHVFREVENLAGVFTITASENLTFCHSHGYADGCPRCKDRSEAEVTAEVNSAIETGVHRGNSNARVVIWDWGWNGHGDARDTISKLPESVWFMSVSEWSLPIKRGGITSEVGEHAISAIGPGPRATRHWSLARRHGLKTVANVHVNTTCELLSLPSLPVIDLIAQHAVNLSDKELDGVMLSWSMGGYPSVNVAVFMSIIDKPDADIDVVLNEVALERYGQQAVGYVRKAWSTFSQAFMEYPYHIDVIYFAPHILGPANLLYLQATGYDATMVGIPYDDLKSWSGPYPPEVLASQFKAVADGWREGVVQMERALTVADDSKKAMVHQDLVLARAAGLHFSSAANQIRFVMSRDHGELRGQNATMILDQEMYLAKQLYDCTLRDSRIGFEASCHYFYVPLDMVEKVINCEDLRRRVCGIGK